MYFKTNSIKNKKRKREEGREDYCKLGGDINVILKIPFLGLSHGREREQRIKIYLILKRKRWVAIIQDQ